MKSGSIISGISIAGVAFLFTASVAGGNVPSDRKILERSEFAIQNYTGLRSNRDELTALSTFRRTHHAAQFLTRLFYPPSLFGPEGDLR